MENPEFIEKLIIKSMLSDKRFITLAAGAFEDRYFDNKESSFIYNNITNHFIEYKEVPSFDMVLNKTTKIDFQEDLKAFKADLDSIEFDIPKNFDFLINSSEEWLKNKALQNAILDSVDIIKKGKNEDYSKVRQYVEDALAKNIITSIGLSYFGDMKTRLERIFSMSEVRIPSYFPVFDEYISNGFPSYSLSIIAAKVHGSKSNIMINMASRQAMHGHRVAMYTLEMGEDAFAQRLDSIYSNLDINRIYSTKRRDLVEKLKNVSKTEGRGEIFIRQFATGMASIQDFRIHTHELIIRDLKPDILYVDYINLMKPYYESKGSMYEDVKRISEELRALSFEFKIPVISVTQLNRAGSMIDLSEVDFMYIAESHGLAATSDFIAILGTDPDKQVYENEIHYKICKNRLGGRVGETDKFYLDNRSLKMWDSSELDDWIKSTKESEGSTKIAS